MSEPFVRTRPGPSGYNAPAQRGNGPIGFDRDNPLAELARLVGKDDPFRDSTQGQARSNNVARFPQLPPPDGPEMLEPVAEQLYQEIPAEPYADASGEPAYQDPNVDLRGSLDEQEPAGEARPRDALRFPAIQAWPPVFDPLQPNDAARQDPQRDAPPLNADLWAEGAMAQGSSFEPGAYDEPATAEEGADGRSPRRTLIVLVSVLALTCGGLGATFLMREGTGRLGSGTPPTILADAGPVKVQSPDMAKDGSTDANTALLEKTGSDKVDNAKVVNTQEQPIDLAQLPKGAPAQADAGASLAAGSPSPFPEPRKVKTILIRPDGSVVGDAAPAQAAMPVTPGVVMPTAADEGADTQAPAAAPPQPPAPVAKPSTPKSTARVSATPKTADGSANGAVSGAKQTGAPTHTPKPKPNVTVADAGAATETAPAATPGTYSVQMAAPGSEQDAKDTAARLQKKYSEELGGLKPSIHKADTGSKSVYRVRVSNLSQDDAKSLCTKLQASGGSCFVVRN